MKTALLLLLAIGVLCTQPGASAHALSVTYEPLGLAFELPDGWETAPQEAVSPETFAGWNDTKRQQQLAEGILTGTFMRDFGEGKADLRVIAASPAGPIGMLQGEQIMNSTSKQLGRMLREFVCFERETVEAGKYKMLHITGSFGSKSEYRIMQYLFSVPEATFRFIFVCEKGAFEELKEDAETIMEGVEAGEQPVPQNPMQRLLKYGYFVLAGALLIWLVSRVLRKRSGGAAASVFLVALLAFCSPCSAEQTASPPPVETELKVNFAMPPGFESASGAARSAILEQVMPYFVEYDSNFASREEYLRQVLPAYMLFASPTGVTGELAAEYHVMVYPICEPAGRTLELSRFHKHYEKFNGFDSDDSGYTMTGNVVLSDHSVNFAALNFIIETPSGDLHGCAYARKYDFGWMVCELIGSREIVSRHSGLLARSAVGMELRDTQDLLFYPSAAGKGIFSERWVRTGIVVLACAVFVLFLARRRR
ncbi:MAG: hypothetical protein U5N86_06860 [Planctomycetota bacterium]|nr:hypothetical protein [Planctomycetota bacterium]